MPFLPSLSHPAHLGDLFTLYPDGATPLLEFIDVVLRGEGALSIGEREMIAAYVSGVNACKFCHDSHLTYARLFGIDEEAIEAALSDLETAPLDRRLKVLLGYVNKLNTLPSKLTQADADAVFEVGISERALFEAVRVAAVFNMMNRLVEGVGVDFDYDAEPGRHPATGSTQAAHAHSYAAFGNMFRDA